MRIHIHHHHHCPQLEEVLERLKTLETLIMSGQTHVNASLQALSAAVTQMATDVSALAQVVRDNAGGNASLESAATEIDNAVTALTTAHQAALAAEALATPPAAAGATTTPAPSGPSTAPPTPTTTT